MPIKDKVQEHQHRCDARDALLAFERKYAGVPGFAKTVDDIRKARELLEQEIAAEERRQPQ